MKRSIRQLLSSRNALAGGSRTENDLQDGPGAENRPQPTLEGQKHHSSDYRRLPTDGYDPHFANFDGFTPYFDDEETIP